MDRTCSRFREDSDLTLANRHAGPVGRGRPDPGRRRRRRRATRHDRPTGWSTRCWAGRWCSSATTATSTLLTTCEAESRHPAPRPRTSAAWQQIGLDPEGAVRVPAGTALDLGATGKAWAADLVAAAVDRRARRAAPWSAWAATSRIAADRRRSRGRSRSRRTRASPAEVTIELDRGGLATSSTRVRRWARRGGPAPPPARSADRAARPDDLAHRDGHRTQRHRRQHGHHRGRRARPRRRRLARRPAASPPGWSADDGTVHATGAWPVEPAVLGADERRGA